MADFDAVFSFFRRIDLMNRLCNGGIQYVARRRKIWDEFLENVAKLMKAEKGCAHDFGHALRIYMKEKWYRNVLGRTL